MDTLDNIETQEPVGEADPTPSGEDTVEAKPFLEFDGRRYDKPDDVIKAMKEVQRKVSEMGNEKRLLELEREQLKLQKASPQKTVDEADWRKRRDALQKRIDEEGGPAILDVLEDFTLGIRDSYDRKFDELTEQFNRQLLDMDPDYRSNSDEIDALQAEYNLSRKDAIKLHRKMNAARAPSNPSRPTPPGTMKSARTTAPADTDDRMAKMLSAELGGLSEKEQEILRQKYGRKS